MGMYTAAGLVKHVKMAVGLKTAYMNSGILREITTKYLNDTIARVEAAGCPASATGYTEDRKAYMRAKIADRGYYGVDCVCLIKSYYWSGKPDGGVGSPKYVGSNDVNAGEMFRRATVKGAINTMPDVPGLILYSKTHPHVGVYIGNGETIESTLGNRGDGVVKRKLDSFWEYWFECPYIEYPSSQTSAPTSGTSGTADTEKKTLDFAAVMRSKPTSDSAMITRFTPGMTVEIVKGTETDFKGVDGKVYVYVKVKWSDKEGWIVKSALRK